METNLQEIKEDLIRELNEKKDNGILEPSNVVLLSKLINNAETIKEAEAIAGLGTIYKRTGFHFDHRLEYDSRDIKYFTKNEALSFVTDKDAKTHKLIIGDNYDALLNLLITYKGLIDVIYIDPPYGSDSMGDFAKTNYTNSLTRDNLLSMLEPRLRIAKQLLSDKGAIFVSIDDKNQAYIKCLMDQIFGENNFIANFPRSTSSGEKTSKYHLNTNIDYILLYCKNSDIFVSSNVMVGKQKSFTEYSNPDNDPKGPWKKDSILIKIDEGRYGYARYGITNPKTNITYYPPVVYNEKDKKQWHYVEDTFNKKLKEGAVIFLDEEPKSGYGFYIKKYLSDSIKSTQNIGTSCFIDKEYQNSNGTKMLKLILKDNPFSYSKPISLIKGILKIINNKDAVVLDFFAGSGTTGHAALDLNKEDGGNRHFILCTNNEITDKNPNGIAYDVTSERLKRVMTGTAYNGLSDFPWLNDNTPYGDNLDVLEISTVADNEQTDGKTPFDVIDETLYGLEFETIEEKIQWICQNFDNTQKYLEEDKDWLKRTKGE